MKTNVQQPTTSTTEQHLNQLREQLRAQKDLVNAELTMKRHLEDSLAMMRMGGAPLSARLELERHLSLCCHRLGVAKGNEDILTARFVTALNR
jgi:hypothetical protein